MERHRYLSRKIIERSSGGDEIHSLSVVSYRGEALGLNSVIAADLTISAFEEEAPMVEYIDCTIIVDRSENLTAIRIE